MLADAREMHGFGDVFQLDPGFLVQHEQVHVVQERYVHIFALQVVAAANNHDG